jgi:carboxypeptidase Taq
MNSHGGLACAQIYDAAGLAVPGLEEQIAAGDFSGLKGFVNEKVHRVGSLYPSGDTLMEQVTGAPLDPSIFLNYLRTKYSKLYSL